MIGVSETARAGRSHRILIEYWYCVILGREDLIANQSQARHDATEKGNWFNVRSGFVRPQHFRFRIIIDHQMHSVISGDRRLKRVASVACKRNVRQSSPTQHGQKELVVMAGRVCMLRAKNTKGRSESGTNVELGP
jgi:hypothetical protein